MSDEDKNCELCKLRVSGIEQKVESLFVAMFHGDNRYPAIKDRVFANELALTTVKASINSIADVMREQANDKKKLMLVIWGGSITFFCSSVLMLVTKLLG